MDSLSPETNGQPESAAGLRAASGSAKSAKAFVKKFCLCWLLQDHQWTCAAEQGIPATPKQLADGIAGFWDYATMYCTRCGKVSELSKRRQL